MGRSERAKYNEFLKEHDHPHSKAAKAFKKNHHQHLHHSHDLVELGAQKMDKEERAQYNQFLKEHDHPHSKAAREFKKQSHTHLGVYDKHHPKKLHKKSKKVDEEASNDEDFA